MFGSLTIDMSHSRQNLCPFFSLMESLPAITLSIALLLAFTKAIVLLATFVVKKYVNNRNILIALFTIVLTKVSYYPSETNEL